MNELLKLHRQRNPTDQRSDEQLTVMYGDRYPQYFDVYPDFKAEYDVLKGDERRAFAPSLVGEFKTGVSRGVESLKETAIGGAALVADTVGLDSFRNKLLENVRQRRESAADNAPTIQGVQDIRGFGDTIRYIAGGAGEVLPSAGEALATAAAGAAIGSALPGPGTAGGALTGLFGRQAMKSLVKKGIAANLTELAAKEGAEQLIKQETRAITARVGQLIATGINSQLLQSGEIFSDTATKPGADLDKALDAAWLGGLVAAVPDTFLPSYVARRFITGVAGKNVTDEAKREFYGYLTRLGSEAAKTIPAEALTEGFQEFVGIASERYVDGKDPLAPINKNELTRIINAGALGAIGGGIAAPVSAIPSPGASQSTQPSLSQTTAGQTVTPPAPAVPPIASGLQDYTGLNPATPEGQAAIDRYRGYAARELAGDEVVASILGTFNPQQRNAYALVKKQVEEEAAARPSASVQADPEPDLDQDFVDALNSIVADNVAREQSQSQPAANIPPVVAADSSSAPVPESPAPVTPVVQAVQEPTVPVESTPTVPSPVATTPAQPVSPAPPAVAAPAALIDQIDFTTRPLKKETAKIRGVDRPVLPSYFEVADHTKPDLGDDLTSGSSPTDQNAADTQTHRLTFFEDQETGQVYGAPTYTTHYGGKKQVRVAVRGVSSRLSDVANAGAVPIASVRLQAPIHALTYQSPVFPGALEFEAAVTRPARERLAAIGRTGESVERGLQPGGFSEAGERLEEAGEPAEPNYQAELLDSVAEILPRGQLGILNNLTEAQVGEAVVRALEDPENGDIAAYVRRQALVEDINKNEEAKKEFDQASLEDKRSLIHRHVTSLVYTFYAKNGFESRYRELQNPLAAQPERTVAGDLPGRTAQPAPESESTVQPGSVTGTDAGPAERRGGTEEANSPAEAGIDPKPTDTPTDTRYRLGNQISGHRASAVQVRQAWQAALSKAVAAGLDMRVFQQALGELVSEYRRSTTGEAQVLLAMRDVLNPTNKDFVTLLHEVAHDVFAGLPIESQARLHEAIALATDESLALEGFTPRFQGDPTEAVRQEERLVEFTARRMASQGFNAEEAATLAQALWRSVKDLLMRAAMVVMRALGFQANPTLAQAYFQNRVESFLAGDSKPWSVLTWLGGPNLRYDEVVGASSRMPGGSHLPAVYNPDTGLMDYRQSLPDNVEIIRYRNVNDIDAVNPDQVPEQKAPEVASNNNLQELLTKLFAVFDPVQKAAPAGTTILTFEEFIAKVLPSNFSPPTEVVAEYNRQLTAAGISALNPALSLASMNSDAQKAVANMALQMVLNLQAHMAKLAGRAAFDVSGDSGSIQAQFDNGATRLQRLVRDYTNADLTLSLAREAVRDLLAQLRIDVKNVREAGWNRGMIAQLVQDLDGQMDEQVGRQYEKVIDRLYKQLVSDPAAGRRFMDILEAVSAMPMQWQTMNIRMIKEFLRTSGNPVFDPILEDTADSKALLSMVAAFAKDNEIVLDLISLKKNDALKDRAILNQALQDAMGSAADSITKARQKVDKLERLKGVATTILDRMEAVKEKQGKLLTKLAEANRDLAFHADAAAVMRNHAAELERILGARYDSFEAIDGASYILAENPNSSPEAVEGNTRTFKIERNGTLNQEVKDHLRQNQAWLDAHGPGTPLYQGSTWNRLQQQNERILENLADSEMHKQKNSLTTRIFDSMVNRLRLTGHPAALAAARMLNNYVSWSHKFRSETETIGHDFSLSESRAMRATGFRPGRVEEFRSTFYDGGFAFINQNERLLYELPSVEAAQNEALARLRRNFQGNPETQDAVNRPGAWEALENYYRTAARASTRLVEMGKEMGVKVEDANGLLRDVKGAPLFEIMRGVNDQLRLTHRNMREQWLAYQFDRDAVAQAYDTDPNALRQNLAPLFTKDTWENFARPLAYRGGRSVFYAPANTAGEQAFAPMADVRAAFDATPSGDMVQFAERLYDLTATPTSQPKSEFVAETLSTFHSFFESVHEIFREQAAQEPLTIASLQRMLMDARKSDEYPAEWLRHRPYDLKNAREVQIHLAYHGAFGKNANAFRSLMETATRELGLIAEQFDRDVVLPVNRAVPGASKKAYRDRARQLGIDFDQLQKVKRDVAMLQSEKANFNSFVNSQSGLIMEMKPWTELLGAMVAATVQGPGTALVDIISMFKPITQQGPSTQAFSQIGQNFRSLVGENLGSFGSIFFRGLKFNADNARIRHDLGITESANEATFREKVQAIMHDFQPHPGEVIGLGRRAIIVGRTIRAAISTGVRGQNQGQYYRAKPLGLFTQVGQTMHAASIDGVFRVYGDMIARAAEFYRQNPNRVGTTITAADLHYTKKLMGLIRDDEAFDYQKVALIRHGTSLEVLAEDTMKRRQADQNAPVMTKDTLRRIGDIGPSELLQEGNIATRPPGTITNPILSFAVPLVGWSISQFASIGRTFRGPNGETMTWTQRLKGEDKDFNRGMLAMAAMIPISIAFALLREEYDEKILGKKPNVREFGGDDNILAAIEKLARVGTFGIVGDAANSFLNVDTNREFSVDSRVFAISSFLNTSRALSTLIKQGEGTYATVYRPLLQSLGGSGYLQYADALINATGVDVAEGRVVARINVQNYLRSAGRAEEMDVRVGRGMASVPTPTKPWVREMEMSAYANDPKDFVRAHENAIQAAMKMGRDREEAEKYIRQAFMSYHPLRVVFKTKPDEVDYAKLLSAMSDRGQQSVREAIRLFDYYGERLEIRPFFDEDKPKTRTSIASGRFDPNRFFNRALSAQRANSLF